MTTTHLCNPPSSPLVKANTLLAVQVKERPIFTNLGEHQESAVVKRCLDSQEIVAVGVVQLEEKFDLEIVLRQHKPHKETKKNKH